MNASPYRIAIGVTSKPSEAKPIAARPDEETLPDPLVVDQAPHFWEEDIRARDREALLVLIVSLVSIGLGACLLFVAWAFHA